MELTHEQIARYACMPCVDKLDETMAWMANEVLKQRAEAGRLRERVGYLEKAMKYIIDESDDGNPDAGSLIAEDALAGTWKEDEG